MSEWEDDFSEHSEWEDDWWREAANNHNDEDASTPTERLPPAAPTHTHLPPAHDPTAWTTLVAETAALLRTNHECTHEKWRFVRGRHQCEECYHVLPDYIFECRQCRVQACNRCRRNRM